MGTFEAQNPILASKIALLGPESHFGAHFAPWPKRLIKQTVSGTFFRTLGAKMQKRDHFALFWVPKWKICSFSAFFDYFSPKTLKCPLFHFWTIWSLLVPPPTSGSRLGDGWERFGRRLGDGWEGFGRRLGDVREPSGKGLGHVWETFWKRLGPHRWPELETTARPGEESSGGGGAGWGSRRCGSGQPAVPAGGISPTESSWCQRAPGPEVVPLHSYHRRGLTGIHY